MYNKTVLANGIRIVTEKIPYVMSVSTGIWIDVGSRDEAQHERGITHFIEHMLFKGTERRNALDIAKALDGVGGFANAFTSKENVCLHAKVLHWHLPLVVDILTDILLNSTFASEEIDRERQVILQEINMIEDTPDELVHILFQRDFWAGSPLGYPIYGDETTVAGIDRPQIVDYIRRNFLPQRIVIAAAGNLEHQRFVDLVSPLVEQLNGRHADLGRRRPQPSPRRQVINKDLEQVHLCLGVEGSSNVDPDRFAGHLLNVVLGGSMSSRLFQEIREKRGLAYSVYSFLTSHQDTGLLGIYAGVAPELVDQALEVIRRELKRLAQEPISHRETQAAKEYLKGNIYLNAESTDSRMNRIAKNELIFNRFVPFEEIEALVDAVTPEAVMQWAAGRFVDDRLALMLFGPVDESLAAPD